MDKENIQYQLPNGQTVQLHRLTAQDHDTINKWVQKEYLSNLGTVLDLLRDDNERHQFLLAAMEHANTMTFLFGEGREILYGSVYGVTRLVFQMLTNPPLPFEAFHNVFFKDRFYSPEGVDALRAVVEAVYGKDEIDDATTDMPFMSLLYAAGTEGVDNEEAEKTGDGGEGTEQTPEPVDVSVKDE